jgi:DNA-directed RNA polymerase subunit M/transcription elongation factor TFIIS
MTKKFKQVCKCENCGNEADMDLTCSLEEYETASEQTAKETHQHKETKQQVKATGTCTSCGNEADMWIDI